MDKELYEWRVAFSAANEIRSKLEPHCEPEKIKIVGSLRRQCETVHDIDIVLCPKPGSLEFPHFDLMRLLGLSWREIKGKDKLVSGTYAGIPVDLYFATPDTWWTLVLIRTGSKPHNIHLCCRAQEMGMKLHADGTGLEDPAGSGHLTPPLSEESLFKLLLLPYVEPKDRV